MFFWGFFCFFFQRRGVRAVRGLCVAAWRVWCSGSSPLQELERGWVHHMWVGGGINRLLYGPLESVTNHFKEPNEAINPKVVPMTGRRKKCPHTACVSGSDRLWSRLWVYSSLRWWACSLRVIFSRDVHTLLLRVARTQTLVYRPGLGPVRWQDWQDWKTQCGAGEGVDTCGQTAQTVTTLASARIYFLCHTCLIWSCRSTWSIL